MNGCTVNIADFRCRASQPRADRPISRSENASAGPSLVYSRSSNRSDVYDISEAREARPMRTRHAVRPISFQRRSNVLRFRTNEPVCMMVRMAEQPRESFRGVAESSFDLPPAA